MMNTNPPEFYDVINIGSSPIMLLEAAFGAEKGDRVAVVEQDTALGGAWRNHQLELPDESSASWLKGRPAQISVETACHLIENFHGIYDGLEKRSGVRFDRLVPQPIKVFNNGRRTAYSSRWRVLAEGTRALLGLLAAIGFRAIERATARRTTSDRFRGATVQSKWLQFHQWVRWKSPLLLWGADIRWPSDGIADFVDSLIRGCRDKGVVFFHSRVVEVERTASGNLIRCQGGKLLACARLKCSESVSLQFVGRDLKIAGPSAAKDFWHGIIKVAPGHVLERNRYVHFANNERIHRISYLNDRMIPEEAFGALFIVQFRYRPIDCGSVERDIEAALRQSKCFKAGVSFQCIEFFESAHLSSGKDSSIDSSRVGSNLEVVKSVGDLARCLTYRPSCGG